MEIETLKSLDATDLNNLHTTSPLRKEQHVDVINIDDSSSVTFLIPK